MSYAIVDIIHCFSNQTFVLSMCQIDLYCPRTFSAPNVSMMNENVKYAHALAGNARMMAGPNPLYSPRTPSSRMTARARGKNFDAGVPSCSLIMRLWMTSMWSVDAIAMG